MLVPLSVRLISFQELLGTVIVTPDPPETLIAATSTSPTAVEVGVESVRLVAPVVEAVVVLIHEMALAKLDADDPETYATFGGFADIARTFVAGEPHELELVLGPRVPNATRWIAGL